MMEEPSNLVSLDTSLFKMKVTLTMMSRHFFLSSLPTFLFLLLFFVVFSFQKLQVTLYRRRRKTTRLMKMMMMMRWPLQRPDRQDRPLTHLASTSFWSIPTLKCLLLEWWKERGKVYRNGCCDDYGCFPGSFLPCLSSSSLPLFFFLVPNALFLPSLFVFLGLLFFQGSSFWFLSFRVRAIYQRNVWERERELMGERKERKKPDQSGREGGQGWGVEEDRGEPNLEPTWKEKSWCAAHEDEESTFLAWKKPFSPSMNFFLFTLLFHVFFFFLSSLNEV